MAPFEHLPNLALSSMTGVELDAADAAVKTLLDLKQYLGGTYRKSLQALAVDIRSEQEERKVISMSPLFQGDRPDPPPAA